MKTFKFIKRVAVAITLFHSALSFSLGMNDISILVPLPAVPELNLLLSPTDKGSKGELLPRQIYKLLPNLVLNQGSQDEIYDNTLKVIGIRIDPCFFDGPVNAPIACQRQIRFVWQPLIINEKNEVNTIDASLHSFYLLTAQEWDNLITEVKKISTTDIHSPLQVHPTLKTEGFAGPYWKNLTSLILKYAGEENFIKVTAMTMRAERVWGFMGVSKNTAGDWERVSIPTLSHPHHPGSEMKGQSYFLTPEGMKNLNEFTGTISMLEPGETNWHRLVSDSKKYLDTATEQEVKNLIDRALKIENPKLHNSGTTDCVSCHLAQPVRLWGESHYPQFDFAKSLSQSLYKNTKANLNNLSVSPHETNRLRMFGYFDQDPILSQRIINETAEILSGLK